MPSKEPTFFETAAEFRAWLRRHGGSAPELVVGFRKRDSGLPRMSWPASVDEQVQHAELSPAQRPASRKHRRAWQFFEAQPTSCRHKAAWHVTSAKREETRQARLARLIEASANGQRT